MSANLYLVEDLTTGLFDGYYKTFETANESRESWQKRFPDNQFVVKHVVKFRELQNSEMLNCSSWYLNESTSNGN